LVTGVSPLAVERVLLGRIIWIVKLSPSARVLTSSSPVVELAVVAVPRATSASATPSLRATFCPRRCGRSRRRCAGRRRRLAENLCPRLLVATLLLLSISFLLGADLLWAEHNLFLGVRVAVVLEAHLGEARDGISLGDEGFAAEDLDLGLEVGRGLRDLAVRLEEVEGLRRIAAMEDERKTQ
jgi:hypothetical protein